MSSLLANGRMFSGSPFEQSRQQAERRYGVRLLLEKLPRQVRNLIIPRGEGRTQGFHLSQKDPVLVFECGDAPLRILVFWICHRASQLMLCLVRI